MFLKKVFINFIVTLCCLVSFCKNRKKLQESVEVPVLRRVFPDIREIVETLPEQDIKTIAKSVLRPPSRRKIRVQIAVVGGAFENPLSSYLVHLTGLSLKVSLPYIICQNDDMKQVLGNSGDISAFPLVDENGANGIFVRLTRIHSLVIGSGLTPKVENFQHIIYAINYIKKNPGMFSRVSLIFDRQGIDFLGNNTKILKDYPGSIYILLERKELIKLWAYYFKYDIGYKVQDNWPELVEKINHNAILIVEDVKKKDIIVSTNGTYTCTIPPKNWRPFWGQGDILAGLLGVYSYWAHLYKERVNPPLNVTIEILTSYAACAVARIGGQIAVKEKSSYLIAKDVIERLSAADEEFFGPYYI